MSNHIEEINYQKRELPKSIYKLGIAIAVIGLIMSAIAFLVDPLRASANSVITFMFMLSVGLGALFLVALEYLVGAVWSVPMRRVMEFLAAVLLIVPVFAIPGLLNLHDLFHWTHTEYVAKDEILQGKTPYLNVPFFIGRVVVVLALYILFYYLITKNSRKQDSTKDTKLTRKNIILSAVFMPIFAISITLMAIDWMMSLEPHWYSTIFGVYYFAGTFLAALAFGSYIAVTLNEKGYLVSGINKDHYYSMGALLYGFTNFWAYIAFSQFLLIWYANIPEETFWFLARWEGSWKFVSLGLILVHFIVPFALLLAQPAKLNPNRLKLASLWIIFAHFYDLYWLVMPNFSKEGAQLGWIEFSFPILGIGVIIIVFNIMANKYNLAPVGDPKLKRALNFRL